MEGDGGTSIAEERESKKQRRWRYRGVWRQTGREIGAESGVEKVDWRVAVLAV